MSFITSLIVKDALDGSWSLVQDLVYRGNTDTFTITAGFRTDFASVPRLLQSFAPKMGRQNRAAVLHDYLYQFAPPVLKKAGFVPITRLEADRIFRRVMREEGVGLWRRNVFYRSVRAGGWRAWNRYRKKCS